MHVSSTSRRRRSAERASSEPARSIVIVGAGFAGAALAYHLLRHADAELRVTLIERGPHVGRGLAYAVDDPSFRLNVPAAKMSLDPSNPDDFVRFAGAEHGRDSFLARALYGSYVETRLREMRQRSAGRLRIVRADAVAIDAHAVQLADGRRELGDRIVLATGHAQRAALAAWPVDARIVDGWDERALERLPRDGRILLIGTGLSALDAINWLERRGHRGELVALSRHGLLPRPHAPRAGAYAISAELGDAPSSLSALVRFLRRLVVDAIRSGHCWQHALDALRPRWPAMWRSLSAHDRVRFARLVRPYWEVLRHRAPIDLLERIEARRMRGDLDVRAGRILACRSERDAVEVRLRRRGGEVRVERFDAIVRCLGPALPDESPLMAALVASGLARPDEAGLGIATSDDGRVIDATGRASDRLFALGPPCRASRWETTAVPEIVRDAVALANELDSSERAFERLGS